jgi:hypothetical protein
MRSEQVDQDPASSAWVTGVIWDEQEQVAVGRAGYHGPPDDPGWPLTITHCLHADAFLSHQTRPGTTSSAGVPPAEVPALDGLEQALGAYRDLGGLYGAKPSPSRGSGNCDG